MHLFFLSLSHIFSIAQQIETNIDLHQMRMMKFWESVMEQAKKTKKYAITLKSGKQAIKKVKVTLKVKGKPTR